jgi:hypothetical protein
LVVTIPINAVVELAPATAPRIAEACGKHLAAELPKPVESELPNPPNPPNAPLATSVGFIDLNDQVSVNDVALFAKNFSKSKKFFKAPSEDAVVIMLISPGGKNPDGSLKLFAMFGETSVDGINAVADGVITGAASTTNRFWVWVIAEMSTVGSVKRP